MSDVKNSASSASAAGPQNTSHQFLSFHLTASLQALLPTAQLGEIVSLEANQIVPIFDLPEAVMGICNHRGEVLWIVDLAGLLGFETLFTQNCRQLYSVLVIHRQQSHVGVAVRQVGQLIRSPSAKIQPIQSLMADLSPKLAFCLRGLYQSTDQKTMLILDGEKVLDLLKAD